MAKFERFTSPCGEAERRKLAALAAQLECSQSDAKRFLIRAAAKQLNADTTIRRSTKNKKGLANSSESRMNQKRGRSRERDKGDRREVVWMWIQRVVDVAAKLVPVLIELARYFSQSAK
ncbi:MAG: hypothetical protein FJ009_02890 [Chloroflexi bacterium]|nr:hypothetical protein [Chloroflexota bacterium]